MKKKSNEGKVKSVVRTRRAKVEAKSAAKVEAGAKVAAKNRKRGVSIFWAVGAILALAVVIALIVVLNQPEKISQDFFVTDDTKVVMSIDGELSAMEEGEYEPEVTRWVYFHNGEKVTNVKVYYEYEDEEDAAEAFDNITMSEFVAGKVLNGKYIVLQMKDDELGDISLEDIREQVEAMEAAGVLVDDYESED